MTLGQLMKYVKISAIPMEILQSNHNGHILLINGHSVILSPSKMGSLGEKTLKEMIEKHYAIPYDPNKIIKKPWEQKQWEKKG
jgi:hypothetical protein